MEFKQLEAFVAVLDAKSFSKAAEKLFITQPAVSAQISALERDLNSKLLIRGPRDLQATKEGLIFYRYAKEILRTRNRSIFALQNMKKEEEGVISIGASSIPAQYFLPPLIAAFQQQTPNVSFRVFRIHSSQQILQDVVDAKYDLGVTGIQVSAADCEVNHLTNDRWVVITPNTSRYQALLRKKTFSLRNLHEERFIYREPGSGTRKDIDLFLKQCGVNPTDLQIAAEIDDTASIIELVSSGVGISIVSQQSVKNARASGKVLTAAFPGTVSSRGIYLIRNRKIPQSAITKKFYDFALEYYKK